MKITELSAYDARGGTVTEWRPRPATPAADPRPPSYLQEQHVRVAAAQHAAGVHAPTWLATAFDLPGGLDQHALRTALAGWTTRHETLRSRFRFSGTGLRRFTLNAMSFEPHDIGEIADPDELHRYLEDRFDRGTSPLDWPPYLIFTVHGPDRATIYLAFDHTNVDGYSLFLIADEFNELYSAALAGRPPELPEVGSYPDFCAAERIRAADVGADDAAVARWREFLRDSGGEQPVFPLELDVPPGPPPAQRSEADWLLDSAEAERFNAACKQSGGSFLSGVLATAAIAASELGDTEVYRTVVPFHTRSHQRWAASLGWYVGLAPFELSTAETADFRDLVRAASDETRAAKHLAEVPLARVCELLGGLFLPRSAVSYMDVRQVAGADRWRTWNAQTFGKVSLGDEVYIWVLRTPDGVYLASRYPNTDLAYKNMSRYIERMREVFITVAETGTYYVTRPASDS
ncbi:condensation domain-containing protein [Saccharopolyspora taberi]|uniref:Condensation domain-containing protein n=1 Tax=Saccharopolyspora taberi TaxID=60895 RepID=A0ABN3VHQ5_9PSEU